MTRDEALVIFGLESDADQAMIKTVYRRRMRAIHPDLGPATDRAWRTAESARLSSAHTILTSQAAGAPSSVRSARSASSMPSSAPRAASPTGSTQKTSGSSSKSSSPATPSGRPIPVFDRPLSRIGLLFHFATRDTIGCWVALAVAVGLSILVEGPSSHGLIVLLLTGSLLTLQAGLGARGLSSPSGLLIGILRFGTDSASAILFGILKLAERKPILT